MATVIEFHTLMILLSLPYNMTVPLEYDCRVWISIGNDCTHIVCEYVCHFGKLYP